MTINLKTFLGYLIDYGEDRLQSEPNRKKRRKPELFEYFCEKCEYAATTASILKHHIQNKHDGVRYSCNKCEYAATTTSSLKIHIESKHEGVRYPCDKCK